MIHREKIPKTFRSVRLAPIKNCSQCGLPKPLSCFFKDSRSLDGHRSNCKSCHTRVMANCRNKFGGANKTNYWKKNNRIKINEYDRKRRSDPKVKLTVNFSNSIRISLNKNKKGHKWESIVGYNLKQLRSHLQKQFLPGMTWENYGPVWHIDHKIPISAFDFKSYEDIDFLKCWSLENLRPLWSKENLIKSKKLFFNFQMSLPLDIRGSMTKGINVSQGG